MHGNWVRVRILCKKGQNNVSELEGSKNEEKSTWNTATLDTWSRTLKFK